MANSGYSTAELLALRNARLSPHAGNASPVIDGPRAALPLVEYQAFYRSVVASSDAAFAFAHYDAESDRRQVVLPCDGGVRWAEERLPAGVFGGKSRMSRWLRYGRGVACFNLYPSCVRDLKINELLWRVARGGEYLPEDGNFVLEANVLSLAMPSKFFEFLARVSRQELKVRMLQVLMLIAEDEDVEGLALMKSELEESTWDDLMLYMRERRANPLMDNTTESGLELMRDVEMLLRLCYLSPWKIDVYAGYVTPHDMSAVLAEAKTSGSLEVGLPDFDVCDRKLVRSSARRPVSFASLHQSNLPPRGGTSKTRVFWKLFQDWRRYRKVLVQGLDRHPAEVTQTMLKSISQGTQKEAWERAEQVMAIACQRGNLLSSLPREVVFNIIAPYVLLAGSEA